MNFKNYFNSISTFQKVEIYFLSIIFFGFIYYLYSTNYKINTTQNQNKKVELYKKAIKDIKKRYSKKENLYLIKHIESLCNKESIEIENIKIDKSKIQATIIGNYQNIINFIYTIEKNLSILELELIRENKNIKATLLINTKYFYNSSDNTTLKTKIANPFIKPSPNKILHKKQESYKLAAIFNQTALINNHWYKIGDKIDHFILEKIEINTIYLKNDKTNNIKTLRVYSE